MSISVVLSILAVVLTILYFLRIKPLPKELFGTWVGDAKPHESRIRRDCTAVGKLIDRPEQGYTTLYEMLESFPTKNQPHLIGYRDQLECIPFKTVKSIVDGKEVEKKLYKYKMSDYKYFSDVEFYDYVHAIANGLAEAGFKKGDKIAFYCETRYEWMAMVLACSCRGIIVVTVYATLGTDAVNIAIKETDIAGALVSAETYSKLTELEFYKSKRIRTICCDDIDLDENGIKLKDMLNAPKVDDDIPNPDDIAIIMYTSGTAGSPKGVVALQKNLLGITHSFVHKLGYSKETRYICYLPLAHIFELTIEFCCLVWGATLGYSSQRTLTPAFMHESQCDLHAFG
ncbi:Long-chain-fatty-acid--CoA ligase [Entamoeba marina]